MKRIHIHVGVDDLNEGIEFYSALFGSQPTKLRDDYAKWLLEDPKLNFAISTRADRKGLDHFGIQAEKILNWMICAQECAVRRCLCTTRVK